MKIINEKIEVIGLESIAKSRMILINQDVPKLCLTIVINDNQLSVQDRTYLIDRVTTFNAFNETTKEEKIKLKEFLNKELDQESIDKINSILST